MEVEKLKGSINEDWLIRLAPFIESVEFDKIVRYIATRRKEVNVCPGKGDTFKALNLCSYENLKVVLALQDPYHTPLGQNGCIADGLAMSCSYSKYPQPSLKHVHSAIQETIGSNNIGVNQYDLSYLAKQGVLLINKSLTVEQGKPNSHQGIWDKFHDSLFAEISKKSHPLVYLLMGNDSIGYFSKHARPMYDIIITTKHPASAAYSGGKWQHNNVFNKVNEVLEENNLKPIEW